MATAELTVEPLREPIMAAPVSQRRIVWQRFRRHRLAVVGVGVLTFLLLLSFVGPLLSPYGPNALVGGPNLDPSVQHWFGTDEIGRDVLTRLMWAGRISIVFAVLVTVASTFIGVAVGATSGYFGGYTDAASMRFVDFLLVLPLLPLLLILSAMYQRGGLPVSTPALVNHFFAWLWSMQADQAERILILAVIIIAFSWTTTARLVRGQVLSLKSQDFTAASQALGMSGRSIIWRHMIPNSMAPIIVTATFGFGGVIILEAVLSFLGFGVQNPSASWGNMLNNVREFMLVQPWRAFIPGLTIFAAALSFNFIGDALRDALDPRLKR
jgi:peptide/nickel transport system permease protein